MCNCLFWAIRSLWETTPTSAPSSSITGAPLDLVGGQDFGQLPDVGVRVTVITSVLMMSAAVNAIRLDLLGTIAFLRLFTHGFGLSSHEAAPESGEPLQEVRSQQAGRPRSAAARSAARPWANTPSRRHRWRTGPGRSARDHCGQHVAHTAGKPCADRRCCSDTAAVTERPPRSGSL
jgi:hypothetical protein